MKVSQLPYRRVTAGEFKAAADKAVAAINNAACVDDILAARQEYLKTVEDFSTASSLSYMRYSINTADEFYLKEKDYYDEAGPTAQSCALQYAAALLDSPFRAELEKALSPVLFKSMEVQRRCMSPEIVADMVEENNLSANIPSSWPAWNSIFAAKSCPGPC